MNDLTPFRDLGIALALGLLIGLERGWSARAEPAGGRVAGIRTFGLVGLVGGLAGVLAASVSEAAAAMLIVATAAALVAGYVRDMTEGDSVSATSTIAALATLALGMLATSGQPLLAAVAAGSMLLLLAMRQELHAWVRGLSALEIKAVARFALIAIVVWPLLPDVSYGPYDAWNPRDIWFVVVLISGLSFAGYVAAKRLGAVSGALATASAGAIVSSTAVTAALARRLRTGEADAPLAAAISAAGAVMMMRALALTALLAPRALATLAVVIVPAALAALAAACLTLRRGRAHAAAPAQAPRNPFDIRPAIAFAALIAGAALVARWAADIFGDHGLAVVLAITGALDVDAAIVTLGGLPDDAVDPALAGIILAVPILANTLFKAGVTVALAGWRQGRSGAAALTASLVTGVAALAAAALAVL